MKSTELEIMNTGIEFVTGHLILEKAIPAKEAVT
jgi:hypothetical protein